MDILNNLALGFSVAGSPENLMYCFIGALLGTFIGVLPGIGRRDDRDAAAADLLPDADRFADHAGRHLLRLAYGGSTTAILVNLPRRSVVLGDRHRRLQNGPARQSRNGAGDCRHRLVYSRHHRHAVDRRFRRPAQLHRAAIRLARILRTDRPRLHRLHGVAHGSIVKGLP